MTIPRTLMVLAAAAFVSAAALPAVAQKADAHGDPKLAALAKITPDVAHQIALKARAGKVASWELEKESGGSGLRYSFDIKQGAKTYEVGVDAADGKILENGAETAAQEAREKKADK